MSQAATVAEHPVHAGLRAAAGALSAAVDASVWQLADDAVESSLATLLDIEAKTAALRSVLLREAETRDLKSGPTPAPTGSKTPAPWANAAATLSST